MITITCKHCKNEITVPMYFSDVKITNESYMALDAVEYRAIATGKAICPLCGNEVREICSNVFSRQDIIDFATKRYKERG
jgi:hypothetical protein